MELNKDIQLESDTILLRKIKKEDYNDLSELAFDEDLWLHTPTFVTKDNLANYINTGIEDWNNGKRLMFSIYSKNHNKIVGSTSIGNIDLKNKRAEIGWTWLGKQYQGTGINKECKLLLLEYCFETLNLNRVEFKTDVNNVRSRKALLKIGAIEEGTLRSHTLLNNGKWRDTIYYSILGTEWKTIKKTIFNL